MLHVIEEFAWPGGFLGWYRSYRPAIAASLTPRFMIAVNAVFLAVGFLVGWLGPTWGRSLSLWLILAALVAGNAIFHIVGMFRLRCYSPGVATAVILYLPLCIWGYWHFVSRGEASVKFALKCFAIGSSYELWSLAIHWKRSARANG
jgi:hypothetical protein